MGTSSSVKNILRESIDNYNYGTQIMIRFEWLIPRRVYEVVYEAFTLFNLLHMRIWVSHTLFRADMGGEVPKWVE